MTHASHVSDASVRSSRSFEMTVPGFPSEEHPSQVLSRAASERSPAWLEEDPFPLIRRADADLEIDVTFDDSFVARDTAPEPPPPLSASVYARHEASYEPESLAEPSPRDWPSRGRTIAARVFAGLVLSGISALFAYQVHMMFENGMRPF